MPLRSQDGGQRCKGRPKNTLFVLTSWFSGKRKRKIFWGWRSEPLSALATMPVTLLLCFGVLEHILISVLLLIYRNFNCAVGKSRLYSLEQAAGKADAMSEVRTGCRRCGREPSASGARVVQKTAWGTNAFCSYCLQQGFGGVFNIEGGNCGQAQKLWQNRSPQRPAGEPIIGSRWTVSGWNECSRNGTKGVERSEAL